MTYYILITGATDGGLSRPNYSAEHCLYASTVVTNDEGSWTKLLGFLQEVFAVKAQLCIRNCQSVGTQNTPSPTRENIARIQRPSANARFTV